MASISLFGRCLGKQPESQRCHIGVDGWSLVGPLVHKCPKTHSGRFGYNIRGNCGLSTMMCVHGAV